MSLQWCFSNPFLLLVKKIKKQYAAREADIVAQAGRKYAITISTNMAGRGTDIILGGNPKVDCSFIDCILINQKP